MKTAVEQLMIALYEGGYLRGNGNEMDDILEKYKEMEKQQIIDSYFKGVCDESDSHGAQSLDMKDAEQYYNETYGSSVLTEGSGAVGEKGGAPTSSQTEISAVQWIINKIESVNPTDFCSIEKIKEWCEQAKVIESEQQQKMVDDALTNYELGWADRKASSQTEISDEEIEKFASDFYDNNGADEFIIMGAKWYREQLKKKQ